jgi:hypothetical protein
VHRPQSSNSTRVKGAAQAIAGAVVGALVYRFWSHGVGTVALAGSSIVFLAAVLSPGVAFAFIEKSLGRLAGLVGWSLTWILLTAVYLLIFTPIALIRRLRGRDPMARTFLPEASSYWQDHAPIAPGIERYKTQF